MFGIFGKRVVAQVSTLSMSTKETIEKIHMAFDVAGDEALGEAQKTLASIKITEAESSSAETLKELGFTSCKLVTKVSDATKVADTARSKAEKVEKYAQKYPQYKFIFEDQVENICKKYNLVCGEVGLYRGEIPTKNIQEIAKFKVAEEDTYYIYDHHWGTTTVSGKDTRDSSFKKRPFYICAPEKDMNTEGHKKKGVFLEREIPDPIVLHYVPGGYLIVSKWGLEGQDPDLVNEKMN